MVLAPLLCLLLSDPDPAQDLAVRPGAGAAAFADQITAPGAQINVPQAQGHSRGVAADQVSSPVGVEHRAAIDGLAQPDRPSLALKSLSNPADGRRTAGQPIGGRDRCESAGAVTADCADIPERRTQDFDRPPPADPALQDLLAAPTGQAPSHGPAPAPALPAGVAGAVAGLPGGGVTVVTIPPPR